MADVVRSEMDLVPFLCEGRRVAHDAGIENQDVQPFALCLELFCCRTDRRERREIKGNVSDVRPAREGLLD